MVELLSKLKLGVSASCGVLSSHLRCYMFHSGAPLDSQQRIYRHSPSSGSPVARTIDHNYLRR